MVTMKANYLDDITDSSLNITFNPSSGYSL